MVGFEVTDEEVAFYESEPGLKSDLLIGFYAGFRTAERLAKIEGLEEVRDWTDWSINPDMCRRIDRRISELKAGN